MIMKLFIRIIANCERSLLTLRIFVAMPIKDKTKAREYFKNYMANLRAKEKGLTNEKENVKPCEDIVVKP
jgi:hypothetical protein